MPVITVRIGEGRSVETKRIAARSITDAVVASLGVERERVTIFFDEFDRENWATGGELHIDKFGPGYGSASDKLLIVGAFHLPPGSLEKARAVMREMIMASRAEKGCVEYSYSEDAIEPGLIRVKEIWANREALRLHFQSDHMKNWRSAWGALQISDRNLALYEVGDPEPI